MIFRLPIKANAISYSISLSLFSDTVGVDRQGWIMGVAAAVVVLAFVITALLISVLSLASIGATLYVAAAAVTAAAILSLITDVTQNA